MSYLRLEGHSLQTPTCKAVEVVAKSYGIYGHGQADYIEVDLGQSKLLEHRNHHGYIILRMFIPAVPKLGSDALQNLQIYKSVHGDFYYI